MTLEERAKLILQERERSLHCPECGASTGTPHLRKCRIARWARLKASDQIGRKLLAGRDAQIKTLQEELEIKENERHAACVSFVNAQAEIAALQAECERLREEIARAALKGEGQ